MYKKILVPLDGSELAEKVLPHVDALARCTGAEIVLVRVPEHIYETAAAYEAYSLFPPIPNWDGDECKEAVKEATGYLNKVRLKLALRGTHVSAQVREGNVGDVIVDLAHELCADLIAMSTHGRTGLNRVVFGSVAEYIIHHAEIPVLLIRSGTLSGPGNAYASTRR